MTDIAKCNNTSCQAKLDCYRFMAIPSEHQYYDSYEPDKKTKLCSGFYPIGDRVNIKEVKDEE